jgi:hypothetical protein
MFTKKRYNKKHLGKTISKKRYNKKHLGKTISKKTKTQKGGFICKTPDIINVQKSYFNKTDDKSVNIVAYGNYLEECSKYSSCVFENINNIELVLDVLKILKDIGNKETNLKYKHIIDTSNEDYENKNIVERNLSNNIITQNETIVNSKFLDIYITSLLKTSLGLNFIDNNTVFLDKDDYDFIINEDTILAKNFIISTIINLEDKLVVKSIIQILSDTLKIILKDKYLLKDFTISIGEMITTQTSREKAIIVSNTLFYSFIQIFLFVFSKYISTLNTAGKSTKSYIVMCVIYKYLFSYIQNILDTAEINGRDKHILPFMNNDKFDEIIIGNNTENIEGLPIFIHLFKTFIGVDCIVKNFLKPERLNILCSELDGYLTKEEPLNKLYDYNFLTEGCVTNILMYGLTIELATKIYYYLYPKK